MLDCEKSSLILRENKVRDMRLILVTLSYGKHCFHKFPTNEEWYIKWMKAEVKKSLNKTFEFTNFRAINFVSISTKVRLIAFLCRKWYIHTYLAGAGVKIPYFFFSRENNSLVTSLFFNVTVRKNENFTATQIFFPSNQFIVK